MQALKEIRQHKAIVIIKIYSSCCNHSFAFCCFAHCDILGCRIKYFIAENIQCNRQQMRLIKSFCFIKPVAELG